MSNPSPYDPNRQYPDPQQRPGQPPSQPDAYGAPQQAYPVQPVQPAAPAPYGYQQAQPVYAPPAVSTTSVTTGGLPTWMHLCYAFLGWIPCFLGWVIWPIHWWFAKSKSVTTAQTAVVYQPPPQQWNPPGPR